MKKVKIISQRGVCIGINHHATSGEIVELEDDDAQWLIDNNKGVLVIEPVIEPAKKAPAKNETVKEV